LLPRCKLLNLAQHPTPRVKLDAPLRLVSLLIEI
jgi:hypothetical protein